MREAFKWSFLIELPSLFMGLILMQLVLSIGSGSWYEMLAGILRFLIGFSLIGLAWIIIKFLTTYVLQATIIEGLPAKDAWKINIQILKKSFGSVLGYYILQLLISTITGIIVGVLSLLNIAVGSLIAFLLNLVFYPSLDTALTGIYLYHRGVKVEPREEKADYIKMVNELFELQ